MVGAEGCQQKLQLACGWHFYDLKPGSLHPGMWRLSHWFNVSSNNSNAACRITYLTIISQNHLRKNIWSKLRATPWGWCFFHFNLFWNKQEQSLIPQLMFPCGTGGCFCLLHGRYCMDTSFVVGVQCWLQAGAEAPPCAHPACPQPAVMGTRLFPSASQTVLLSNSF